MIRKKGEGKPVIMIVAGLGCSKKQVCITSRAEKAGGKMVGT